MHLSIFKRLSTILGLMLLLSAAPKSPAHVSANLALLPQARVTSVELRAENPHPTGSCPVTISFSGFIKTAGPGTVRYTFTRSDGATAPIYTLEFIAAGVQ